MKQSERSETYPGTRLFVTQALAEETLLTPSDKQSHYLLKVLRLRDGDKISLFNGRDGEWLAELQNVRRKTTDLSVKRRLRRQYNSPDIWLCFSPVKYGKIDFIVQKATELGVSRICPIITDRTIVSRVNLERLQTNVIEAAQQCERLDVPEIALPVSFSEMLAQWGERRVIIHADESGGGKVPQEILGKLPPGAAYAVLIGAEGGFSPRERESLRKFTHAHAITLGPRILRADTATIAAITCVMSYLGDWQQQKPRFLYVEEYTS